MRFACLWMVAAIITGCASFPPAPAQTQQPVFTDDALISIDGLALPVSVWEAQTPKAVILAVHGMNDYARAFEQAGAWFSQNAGISLYAYDQRGFGRGDNPGRWPGGDALRADLIAAIQALHMAHPDTPLFVAGHSMGAGVVLSAMAERTLPVEGVILAAPGVWGGSQLPILYRLSANLAAIFAPGKTLTGERAGRQSTDNIPILIEMQKDPYIVKETRVDSVLGVVRLMGEAYDASDEAGGEILFLYGEKDEIIPVKSMQRAAERLCGAVRLEVFEEGWHLLFRDLQAEKVWRTIADWIDAISAAGRANGEVGPAARHCASNNSASGSQQFLAATAGTDNEE